MGVWGVKLYENDIALDIKERFDDLRRGKTVADITKELIDEYSGEMNDVYCAPTFWFALADIQWNLGRLLPEVKERAQSWLNKGGDLSVWQSENPSLVNKRAAVLNELYEKLNSPQPPEKKISQYRIYRCKWKTGDIFAYQFNSEYAKEKGFFNKYIYFVKVEERVWHPGHIVPAVYFFKRIDDVLANVNSLQEVEYIPQFYKPNAYENNPRMKKLYLLTLLNTSSRVIPKKQLTFIGNIGDVKRVENEDLNPLGYSISWNRFETYMIDNYIAWK